MFKNLPVREKIKILIIDESKDDIKKISDLLISNGYLESNLITINDEESFTNGLLEYPQYTRPEVFMDKEVPKVLLSGHHKNINTWRKLESVKLTIKRRPDLFDYKSLDEADKKLLTKYNIVDK